ncbi:hypothetical protein OC845_005777 [Tilletia horrida]|nr:hypothetical protein OC845_005777 [Tilletia horrida]
MTMRAQEDNDEWSTSMREDDGESDSSGEDGADDVRIHATCNPMQAQLQGQPALDIGTIDEAGIKFKDNPFAKAKRQAKLRESHALTSKTSSGSLPRQPSHRISSPASKPGANQKAEGSSTAARSQAQHHPMPPHTLLSPDEYSKPNAYPPGPSCPASKEKTPRPSASQQTQSKEISDGMSLPPSLALLHSLHQSPSVTAREDSTLKSQECHEDDDATQPIPNSDDEPSPFAFNIQDADIGDQSITRNQEAQPASVPVAERFGWPAPYASKLSIGVSSPAPVNPSRSPLRPAWIRTQRIGPSAGQLIFEPLAPELAKTATQTAIASQHSHVEHVQHKHPSSPFLESMSNFLSTFAYDENVHDVAQPSPVLRMQVPTRDGSSKLDSGRIFGQTWHSSSSTLAPTPSPPTTTALRPPQYENTESQSSVWPSLAQKYGPNRSRMERTDPRRWNVASNARSTTGKQLYEPLSGSNAVEDDDEIASWSTLSATRSLQKHRLHALQGPRPPSRAPPQPDLPQRLRATWRTKDDDQTLKSRIGTMTKSSRGGHASASGATIRLSSAFRLPLQSKTHGDTSRQDGRSRGPVDGRQQSPPKRTRLNSAAPGPSQSAAGRPGPSFLDLSNRTSFAPTPLERWKAGWDHN